MKKSELREEKHKKSVEIVRLRKEVDRLNELVKSHSTKITKLVRENSNIKQKFLDVKDFLIAEINNINTGEMKKWLAMNF